MYDLWAEGSTLPRILTIAVAQYLDFKAVDPSGKDNHARCDPHSIAVYKGIAPTAGRPWSEFSTGAIIDSADRV